MKFFVEKIQRWSHGRRLALTLLTRLPSGWTALVALSKATLREDPHRSLRYAERAVRGNPVVWQGHLELVKALESLGLSTEASHAKLVALLVASPASAEHLTKSWFPELDSPSITNVCRECGVDASDLVLVLGELTSLTDDESRLLLAFSRLLEAYGSDELARLDGVHDVLAEHSAVLLAGAMRQAGAVQAPIDLLQPFGSSDTARQVLSGAIQDAAILEGSFALKFQKARPLVSRQHSSLYLLHNSLPYNSGGYATRSHGLIGAIRDSGWNLVPVTRPGFPSRKYVFDQDPDAPGVDVVDGVPYHRIIGSVDSQPRSDLQGFIDLYVDGLEPLVDEYRPQLIHGASNWWNGFAAVATARRHGIPSIYEIRGLWEVTRSSRVSGWETTERFEADVQYEAQAAKLADRVIVITTGLRDEMVRRGVDEERIRVVPNAVNVGQFDGQDYDHDLARSLGIGDEVVVGFAGTFTFYEGIDDLLSAGARIRPECETPFRFLFVGDGPVLDDLREMAMDLKLTDVCTFTGRVPHRDVSRYLSLMSITPFPRKAVLVSEMVSPLKPLESMAAGSVVLASDVKALEEMVPTGAGLLFAKGDIDDLAHKLHLLIDDESLRVRLASKAYRWVRQYRSWEYVATGLVDIYRELVSGSTHDSLTRDGNAT